MIDDSDIINEDILKHAIYCWGNLAQVLMAVEECSELSKALCKSFRCDNPDEVIDEIADVKIMIRQLETMYDKDLIIERVKYKMARLQKRLDKYKEVV